MEENKNILDDLKKRQKPEVPKGFFDNFYDELMAKIAEEESGLVDFQKTTKPDVPAEFFSNFAQDITSQTGKEEPVKPAKQASRIINLKIVGVITAAAACLLVMFFLVPPKDTDNVAQTNVQEPIEEVVNISDEDLLAYVDEDDIIDYILEEDIQVMESDTKEEESNITTDDNTVEDSNDEQFEDLNEEDILYYFEDELDDINLDDLEL